MTRAERRRRTAVAVAAQLRIAVSSTPDAKSARQPGRLRKRHAMDCGRPQCGLCGNPRRVGHKKPQTLQERRSEDLLRQGLQALTASVGDPPDGIGV
jgi:hypothetical protein